MPLPRCTHKQTHMQTHRETEKSENATTTNSIGGRSIKTVFCDKIFPYHFSDSCQIPRHFQVLRQLLKRVALDIILPQPKSSHMMPDMKLDLSICWLFSLTI